MPRQSRDKLFVRQSEWRDVYGGRRDAATESTRALPIDSCMISQAPFTTPVGTRAGTVFELRNIIPFVKEHRKDPVTGEPLTGKEIFKLRFHRNAEGKFACPVTMQLFGPRTRVVAVAPTGNVYAADALAGAKAAAAAPGGDPVAADLLTGAPYDPRPASEGGDVVVLQDPADKAVTALRSSAALHGGAPSKPGTPAASTGDGAAAAGAEPSVAAAPAEAAAPAPAPGGGAAGGSVRLSAMARRALREAAAMPRPEDPALRVARRQRAEAEAEAAANGGAGTGSGVGPGGRRFRTVSDGWAPPALPRVAATAVALLRGGGAGSGAAAGRAPAAAGTAGDCAGGSAVADVDDLYDGLDRQRFRADLARARARGESGALEMLMTSSRAGSAGLTSSVISAGAAGGSGRLGMPPRASLRRLRWKRVAGRRERALVSVRVSIGGRPAGALRFELLCHVAPVACDSFLQLARRGRYDGVAFHRSVRAFMIQGGDPSGTGSGGESCWGGVFPTEADTSRARHDARGKLCMANSGPDTNGSQFFVLFRPAKHLDGKHTVFGSLVGGMDVLRALELVETGDKDKPRRTIAIDGIDIHKDPFWEDAALAAGEAPAAAKGQPTASPAAPAAGTGQAAGSGSVGRYLQLEPAAKRPRGPGL